MIIMSICVCGKRNDTKEKCAASLLRWSSIHIKSARSVEMDLHRFRFDRTDLQMEAILTFSLVFFIGYHLARRCL